jgi:hypothetical protein
MVYVAELFNKNKQKERQREYL